MNIKLAIKNVTKKYNVEVLQSVSFDLYNNEFLSILGSSGCGKTTLLRCLIGIEKFDSGNILLNNAEDITNYSPKDRHMGIVMQNYALFPNMTVERNISFVLKNKKMNKAEIKKEVDDILEKTGLLEHINKYPNELSGGQQQRVAIARTLVMKPEIILFDEPMSALDASTKIRLRKFIKEIQKLYKISIIYITHDQEEAFALSDRIMVMKDGKVEQIGTPKEIYNSPKTEYIKQFIIDELNEKVRSITENIKWTYLK